MANLTIVVDENVLRKAKMSHGQTFDGVRVENPFASAGKPPR